MTGFDSRSSASEDRRAEAAGSDISGMGRKKQMMPGRRGKKEEVPGTCFFLSSHPGGNVSFRRHALFRLIFTLRILPNDSGGGSFSRYVLPTFPSAAERGSSKEKTL